MNILLTSVGRRSYMVAYFKNALKGIGELHAGNSAETFAMSLANKAVITPLIYDDSYIDFLLNYSINYKIDAIISLFDIDLLVLAKNKQKFGRYGINIVVSSAETVQICNDKWHTYQFLTRNNFKTPLTYISVKDCLTGIKSKEIGFPVLVKPRWGSGSQGICLAETPGELDVIYEMTKKYIFKSYLKYESSLDPERSVLIQEKLTGTEFGLDVFNDLQGNFMACIPKRKISMRNGETEKAEIIDCPDLIELGTRLTEKLHHIGDLDVDCFKIGGNYFILELNCRFGGQYPFCHLAGTDFPKAIIYMLSGKAVTADLLQARFGTKGFKDIHPVEIH